MGCNVVLMLPFYYYKHSILAFLSLELAAISVTWAVSMATGLSTSCIAGVFDGG